MRSETPFPSIYPYPLDEEFYEEYEDWELIDEYDPEYIFVEEGSPDFFEETEFVDFNDWTFNAYLVVGLALVVMLIMGVGLRQLSGAANPLNERVEDAKPVGGEGSFVISNPTAVSAPYSQYSLTQGLHGYAYGHMAIDLAAGRGSPILSPIAGFVSQHYIDEYGNTTLVIENDVYAVTLLHGDFQVEIDDEVSLGQVIGQEGNNGYTMDMFGNLCYGRTYCGNHTHLNIFDKQLQTNVNPLDLIR